MHGCRRILDSPNDACLKQFRVGEKQRGIPTEENKPRDETSLRVAADIVITAYPVRPAKDSGVGSPSIPKKFYNGDDHCECDPGYCPERGNACEAQYRKPEFPFLHFIDSDQVLDLDQSNSRGNNDGSESARRQILQEIGSSDNEKCDCQCTNNAGQLSF